MIMTYICIGLALILGYVLRRDFKPMELLRKENERLKLRIENYQIEIKQVKQKTFRAGDVVYISDPERKRFRFNEPHYIIEMYNGNTCAYVHTNPKPQLPLSCIHFGVGVELLSFEPFPTCHCCGKPSN